MILYKSASPSSSKVNRPGVAVRGGVVVASRCAYRNRYVCVVGRDAAALTRVQLALVACPCGHGVDWVGKDRAGCLITSLLLGSKYACY